MKTSDLLLQIIKQNGGKIDAVQIDRWLGELAKLEIISYDWDGPEEGKGQVVIALTEKGQEYVKRRGL
jgi:DNA-binding PadR family transcriptional regulator